MDPRIIRTIGILFDLQQALNKAIKNSIHDDPEEFRTDVRVIVEIAHGAYKALEG